MSKYVILLPIIFPIVAGALLPLFGFRSRRARNIYVELVTALTSVLAVWMILHRPSEDFVLLNLAGELAVMLHIDGLGMVFAALISVLWPFAALYAFEYMEHAEKDNAFFSFYTMTFGVTLGIAFAGNLMTMYMFYEMLTLVTLPLVMHGMDKTAVAAGRKYMTYSIGGAAFAFIGFIFVYRLGDTMNFTFGGVFDGSAIQGKEDLLRIVYVLAVFGFGVKAAIFPFHAWLPSASIAPTPVTALLHAVAVVKSGAFAIIRITYYSYGTDLLAGSFAQKLVLGFAAVTVLYGSVRAVKEPHLKRRLAYSTISNLSYIVFGAALMTPLGMTGGLLHLIAHAFIKITLFYCAGAILHRTGLEYVRDMDGIGRKMPFVTACFFAAGLGLIGIPPMAGFISKWNLGIAGIAEGSEFAVLGVAAVLVSALLTAVYIFGFLIRACFPAALGDRPEALKSAGASDPSWRMKLPMAVLAVMVLMIGIFAEPITEFLTRVSNGLI
ncbi:MAG: proton-conducting membrane transporter [Lachnospiraceae bacterium]|nr:proton-conducting membrane transporter [Lachnospiraceae bacterium]